VDEYLLRHLLGPRLNLHDVARELDPGEPLVREGLVHASSASARPFAGYTVDPIVIHRLRGELLDEDPEGLLPVGGASKPLSELRVAPDVRAQLAAWSARPADRPTRLVIRGRSGSGRRTLIAALAAAANRRLALVRVDQLLDRDRSAVELRRALERCRLAGWIPCIDGTDRLPADDRVSRDRMRHIFAEHRGPLAMRLDGDGRPPLEPGYVQIDVPDLSESERLEVWRTELCARGIESDETAGLAAHWRVGAATIHRVVAELAIPSAALAAGGERAVHETIARAVGQHLERRLGDVAKRIRELPRLEDMVLPADILDSLKEFLSRMRYQRIVFEQWGMAKVATTARGLTALFQGPPGTGKTMVAGALARELGLDLYRVDLSRVLSKWVGETEQNLANVFSAAEEGQAIVLFDEADALFTKRTEVKSSNDRFANLEVNYLLQRLDSFVGIAILTTNLGTAIDAAFKRRLSFRVTFPIPDEDLREQLWRAHLPPNVPQASDIDLAALARKYEFTGGSVRNCVLRAAFLAAAEHKVLSQDHLLRAIRLEYRAAGKLAESGPIE
jgi:AAA+ superfamily predicted ATPase